MKDSSVRRACAAAAFLIAMVETTFTTEAHPGGSIAVDRKGQVYFVDTGRGVWRIDAAGSLSFLGGPRFHWLALDEADRFTRFSRRSAQDEITALAGAAPGVLVSSDYPIAVVDDGLYFAPGNRRPLGLSRTAPDGSTRDAGSFPPAAARAGKPIEWINGLAAAPDGTFYASVDDAILKIAPDGKVSLFASEVRPADCRPGPTLDAPPGPYLRGLAVARNGDVYVASTGCHAVLRITASRAVTTVLRAERGWSPTAVATSGRDVCVLEYDHSPGQHERSWPPRVRKLHADGEIETLATIHR